MPFEGDNMLLAESIRTEASIWGFRRQGDVNRHLIPVEVGVEGRAHQWVDLDGLPLDQNGLKGLNPQAVQGGRTIEQNGMFPNDFLQDIPHDGVLLLHHFFGSLDGGAVSVLFQPIEDKGLEQLQGHPFRESALVQLEVGTDHDNRASGVVHPLPQQVLAEAALLALQGVREGTSGDDCWRRAIRAPSGRCRRAHPRLPGACAFRCEQSRRARAARSASSNDCCD